MPKRQEGQPMNTTPTTHVNGPPQQVQLPQLPQDREHAVASGIAQYHQTAHERDQLQKEVAALKTDMAGYRVIIEAQTTQLNNMESKIETAQMMRDQAVADRAKYEALFITFMAQLRAFNVPAAPLVREARPADDGSGDPSGQG